ncbi:MAG TPA: PKD domain-containing protein, partial [Methanomicrobiales archaeon]|nr:PKD domain-containing protein [Methanomicrobiales archaeon]
NFTDQSTNTPTAWSWDFGDSGTSTLQNPVHVYTAAGTYTVALTATNGDGSGKLVKQNYITVTPKTPPVANFTANVTTGPAPLAVAFTDQSTNTPTAWSWDFGDSGTSTLQNPVHVYTAAGTYTVKLTVTNADGSSTVSKATYITALNSLPTANFSGTPTSGKQPLTVTFTDLSANTPTAWSWDFGDGAASQQQNPVHVYTAPGVYTVSLTVTNAGGSDKMVKQNYITVAIDCGDSQSLVTSDGRTLACAAVSNDNGNLYVAFTGSPSFPLKQADWAWGYQASNIPQTAGVPDPTKFSYTHVFGTGEYSYAFPGVDVSSVLSSDIAYVVLSAHVSTKAGDDAWVVDSTGAKSFTYRLNRVTISFSPPDALLSLPLLETSQTVTITATNGASPVKGATVLFATSFGTFANGLQTATATTDGTGMASVTLSSSSPGTATLTAGVDANGNGIIDPTEWTSSTTIEWLYPKTITVAGSTASIQLPDTTPASLTATVLDQDGFAMEGVPVTFSFAFSDGTTTIRATSMATTDENGVATATLSETTAGTATVTASYGTTTSAATMVTWLADPSAATPATTPTTTPASSP